MRGKMAKDRCHHGKADYRHSHWNAYVAKGTYALVEVPCEKKAPQGRRRASLVG